VLYEFAAGAMALMHSLSRRFWYIHYKQAADMPATANRVWRVMKSASLLQATE
jgi:hypothetical protein